jgi:hypothetical protein
MTEDVHQRIAATWEALNELGDMVAHRNPEDELTLVTMLHEVAKLQVAGQLPQLNGAEDIGNSVYYSFADRNVVTSQRLFYALGMIDDDGISLDVLPVPSANGTQKKV